MARVLILEDEAVLRTSMARGLRKLPALEVLEAGSMAEAVRTLDGTPPDLVFSDIDLPDRTGIEILGEMGKRGLRVPVVFISAFLKAYGAQIPRHGDIEVLTKPVSIEQLRDLVRRRLIEPGDQTAPFSFVDYVRLACMGRHSIQVELLRAGRRAGLLHIVSGDPWFAELDGKVGKEAFGRMVFARDCAVQCGTLQGPPGTRNLESSGEVLLLEAAKLADEAAAAAPPARPVRPAAPPPIDAPPGAAQAAPPAAAAAPVAPPAFDDLFDEAITALLARDMEKAHALFVAASRLRPDDKRVEANLARLRDLGIKGPGGAKGDP